MNWHTRRMLKTAGVAAVGVLLGILADEGLRARRFAGQEDCGRQEAGRVARAPETALSPRLSELASLASAIYANQQRISEDERTIRENGPDALQDDQQRSASLDESIRQQTDLVAALQTELNSRPNRQSAETQVQRFRVNEDDQVFQQSLAALDDQIRAQDQIVRTQEQQLALAVGPADSDFMIAQNNQTQAERAKLGQLRAQHQAVLAARQANARQTYAVEAQQLQNQQAGSVDLSMAQSEAQTELKRLQEERQSVDRQVAQRQAASDQAAGERQKLLDANQALQEKMRALQYNS